MCPNSRELMPGLFALKYFTNDDSTLTEIGIMPGKLAFYVRNFYFSPQLLCKNHHATIKTNT